MSAADARDEIDTRAVVGEPRRLIGRRPTRVNRDRRASVRAARQPVSADNPLLAMERATSSWVTTCLETFGEFRDFHTDHRVAVRGVHPDLSRISQ